ncbi:50S ribosome-binding GTPase [Candidatus Woesearchaeota archaeon]|nr:50S ribosome-binding GTPase [Candidatus Woesearchaeota archaeon]
MAFDKIPPVKNSEFYLDIALRQGKRAAVQRQRRRDNPIARKRGYELTRIEAIGKILTGEFGAIVDSFPRFDELSEFYKELVRLSFDVPEYRRSLARVNIAGNSLRRLTMEYSRRVRWARDEESISRHARAYTGRASSYVKQIKEVFPVLQHARTKFREFPLIKPDIFTVCLVGFPNVGKTTLLTKLTTADPEINSYPFTTKSLNLGYFSIGSQKIQVIDAPGSLNRLDKMNNIEKQAYLAIRLAANFLVYVFDPSESYPMALQEKLFSLMSGLGKKMVVYVSKADIEPEAAALIAKKYKGFTSPVELKKSISGMV